MEHIKGKDAEAIAARARALESYLRDSGEFGYTLEMDVVDPSLDPVEDFLVNRKQGHCEYFASALALLLCGRSTSRRGMVNGFKGGDWNELTQTMNVRQKHAHSWVEAYVGSRRAEQPALDHSRPDAGHRPRRIGRPGRRRRRELPPVTDMVRYVWVFYILGFDCSRQNRLFYAPITVMVQKVRRGYATLWELSRRAFAQLFNFQSISSFISIRGFLVSFLVLSLVAAAWQAAALAGQAAVPVVARADRRSRPG